MTIHANVGLKSEPHHVVRSMLLEEPGAVDPYRDSEGRRYITVRAADSEGHRSSAQILVNRMYERRGYTTTPLPSVSNAERVTFIANDHHKTIGTVTVAFDGNDGLLVDQLFRDHVDELRDRGEVLCEFIKLAVDSGARSKPVLGSLFHTAFIYAREIKGCHRIVIEVNPRHVRFYRSMLGFSVLARERFNPRVSAPAVLMGLDLADAEELIMQAHSCSTRARYERSFYRDCFSNEEMAGIVSRLRGRSDA